MKKFTRRELILVYIACLLTLIFASYYLVYIPSGVRYEETKSRLETAKAEKMRMEYELGSIASVKTEYARKKDLLRKQLNLDSVTNSADTEQKVLLYLTTCGITAEKTRISAIEEHEWKDGNTKAYVYIASLNINAFGSWDSFKRLLDETKADLRIRITEFSLDEKSRENLAGGKTLNIALTVEYYMLCPEDSPGKNVKKRNQS